MKYIAVLSVLAVACLLASPALAAQNGKASQNGLAGQDGPGASMAPARTAGIPTAHMEARMVWAIRISMVRKMITVQPLRMAKVLKVARLLKCKSGQRLQQPQLPIW